MATTKNGIYYPGDYNAKADIPTDLKKMAESIDKNVQDNKYNDEPIKQDIQELQTDVSDIKSEQETQNDLLQRTQSALINITTPKSSNINVKDSSDLNAKIDVYGISEQDGEPSPSNIVDIENVTGDIDITVCNKNWFKILSEINKTYITVNNNNTLTINGTIAQNESFAFSRIRLKKGTYTFSLGDYSKITNCYYNIKDLDTGEVIKNFNYTDVTIEIDKDKNIELSFVVMAGTYNNVLIKPQVEVENKATSWVEHKEQLITFPLSEGQKLYNGDYPASDGIHHVRKQVVLDGTENWMVSGNSYYLTVAGKKLRYELTKGKMLCTHFKETEGVGTGDLQLNEFFEGYYVTGNRNAFFNYDNGVGGVDNWKSYLAEQKQAGTPVILEYELEEEEIEPYTEEQQEAYNQLQNVLSYKTETNVFTDKAQLVFKYIADTQTWTVNLVKSEVANTNQQILEIAGGN